MTVTSGASEGATEAVWPIVRQEQKERTVSVLFDKPHSMTCPEVGQIARLHAYLTVFDDLRIVESVRATVRHGNPIAESLLRLHVFTEMPLADQSTGVSSFGQDFRQGAELFYCAISIGPHLSLVTTQITMNSMLGGYQACEIRRARRRANCIGAESLGKTDSFFCKAVDVRCPDVGISITAQGPGAMVVGHDEYNIRTAPGS